MVNGKFNLYNYFVKKLFSFFVLFFFLSLALASTVHAQESSPTSYDITYKIREDGSTNVLFNISIENTTVNYYTSSYALEVGFEDIRNILASDTNGAIEPAVSKTNLGQQIKLNFNSRVVGKGNKLIFNLSFDTNDIAKNQGNIWEINIPGLSEKKGYDVFDVHVKVPVSFGNPIYVKPETAINDLNFTKEELGKSGISVTFGDSQIYSFNLKYHIKNSNLFPIKTEITLPPTTNYQDILIDDITPKPLNVQKDKDGNWLATYFLMPSEKRHIFVKGKARLALYPKKQALSKSEQIEYLKERPYWNISDNKIKKLAKDLKTPNAIYEYVARTLTYDFSRITTDKPRLGALDVLNNPSSAVCMEFTDLFIALSRAAGIPAREVDGFAYTQNSKQRPLSLVKDVLHAWPEYYDFEKQTWVMIDPTWGNTTGGVDYFNTLDFDHLAFVIRGVNSEYPVPAGGYKFAGFENSKDVNVDFADTFEEINPSIDIKLDMPSKFFSIMPVTGNIILINKKSVLFPSQILTIRTDSLDPKERNIKTEEIPPYGTIKIPVVFQKTSFFDIKKAIIEFRINDKAIYQTVDISPLNFLSFLKFNK